MYDIQKISYRIDASNQFVTEFYNVVFSSFILQLPWNIAFKLHSFFTRLWNGREILRTDQGVGSGGGVGVGVVERWKYFADYSMEGNPWMRIPKIRQFNCIHRGGGGGYSIRLDFILFYFFIIFSYLFYSFMQLFCIHQITYSIKCDALFYVWLCVSICVQANECKFVERSE